MEDFVSFEIAKKLKEKGFDWETSDVYERNTIACRYEDYPKPTISQVLNWLREEFSLHISQKPYACKDGLLWMYEIRKFNKRIVFVIANKTGFVEEEQAALAGIEYVIDNLI